VRSARCSLRGDCTKQQAGTNPRCVTPSSDHFGTILNKSIDLPLLWRNESLGILHLDLTNITSLAYMLVLSGGRGINHQGFHDLPDLTGLPIQTVAIFDMPICCSTSCRRGPRLCQGTAGITGGCFCPLCHWEWPRP
jgi:hypothetical protein